MAPEIPFPRLFCSHLAHFLEHKEAVLSSGNWRMEMRHEGLERFSFFDV